MELHFLESGKIVDDKQAEAIREMQRPQEPRNSIPQGFWEQNAPSPNTIARPKPAPIKSLEELQAEVDASSAELTAAQETYQRDKHSDPYEAEKRELSSFLALYEARVNNAKLRLAELHAKPSPFAQFLTSIAALEQRTQNIARWLRTTLAERYAQNLHDQGFDGLDKEAKKRILNRNALQPLRDMSTPLFVRFSRTAAESRTLEQAELTIERVKQATETLRESINQHLA
jgi:hypothetical protein